MSETQTGGVSDDPGRIIYELEQRLAAVIKQNEQAQRYVSDANESLNEKAAKIERLQARLAEHGAEIDRLRLQIRESNAHYDRMRLEFNAAQQLRSEVQQLERLLDEARENLRELREDRQAVESHCEGMKAAFLATITALAGVRS